MAGGWLSFTAGRDFYGHSLQDDLTRAQTKVIREIAEKGPCVIVGRCADYILKDRTDVVHFFICADMDFRKERAIRIDGVDIRDLALKDLRDRLGYIPQKAVLFSGTIAENLRFGREGAGEDELKAAVDIAQAGDFVYADNDGLEARIAQGGANISGGQKQRLSIARAIVKKPEFYLFDDSFSALDFKTDAAVRKRLGTECAGVTKLIVAQRVSTIMHADMILVLHDGKVIGKGTHEELMADCPT